MFQISLFFGIDPWRRQFHSSILRRTINLDAVFARLYFFLPPRSVFRPDLRRDGFLPTCQQPTWNFSL